MRGIEIRQPPLAGTAFPPVPPPVALAARLAVYWLLLVGAGSVGVTVRTCLARIGIWPLRLTDPATRSEGAVP